MINGKFCSKTPVARRFYTMANVKYFLEKKKYL
jgi:hypothetical protein